MLPRERKQRCWITPPPTEEYMIFVRSQTGLPWQIGPVKKKDSIAKIKRMIEDKVYIPTDQQRLFFNGKELDYSKTLEQSYIKKEDTLLIRK